MPHPYHPRTLLDEAVPLLGRTSTASRREDELHERRNLRNTPIRQTRTAGHRPNQLWSWTSPAQGRRSDLLLLYVIIDVFSRYVVG